MLEVWDALLAVAAGVAAGAINAVVGSGSLITFPTLVAIGLPPVVANVSNNIGLVPGSFSGAYGYRRELEGQRERLVRLAAGSALGSLLGGWLLIVLDPGVFRVVVPVLIGLACVLVVIQPWLSRWMAARREHAHPHGGPWLWLGVFGAGVYGGYFGAAQGVLLIGILGSFLDEGIQRINAAKNVLSLVVNFTAAVLFLVIASVNWWAVAAVAVGSTIGGYFGARVGRRIPAPLLRGIIVCVGIVAIIKLMYG
ncbi:sulfite exporter TauE/SafE family protein [Thermoactinospora rubra]|uniref:sulfite exporter TauE/SafE family protein n=1 Tax=Thermoactinospora rubra TaxID=1088767 RepID=UPI000A120C36|nr:sulfite exporter TauE/SafE family protein [Thermoactinospora rubra]